jgi:hypothetical protein
MIAEFKVGGRYENRKGPYEVIGRLDLDDVQGMDIFLLNTQQGKAKAS